MFVRLFSGLATVASRGKSGQGENGEAGRELDERNMAWHVRCCLGWLERSCSDDSEIFFRTRYGIQSWKKWSGEWGRSSEGVDEKSMEWAVRCCLVSLGICCSDVCEIFSGLATVASRGKSGQGKNGGRPGIELDERSMAWNVRLSLIHI